MRARIEESKRYRSFNGPACGFSVSAVSEVGVAAECGSRPGGEGGSEGGGDRASSTRAHPQRCSHWLRRPQGSCGSGGEREGDVGPGDGGEGLEVGTPPDGAEEVGSGRVPTWSTLKSEPFWLLDFNVLLLGSLRVGTPPGGAEEVGSGRVPTWSTR